MSRKAGNLLIILGTALIVGALILFLYNLQEDRLAGEASVIHLEQLVTQIEQTEPTHPGDENASPSPTEPLVPIIPEELLTAEDVKMKEALVDGHRFIGYLIMPTLELELPILSEWSYKLLQIAPCRYYGTLRGNDLVLMAHNYATHFGTISSLKPGDPVMFVDVDGHTTQYEVVAQDVLDPYAVEEMISGDFDLTLFTCTYGGKSRITVYCDRTS